MLMVTLPALHSMIKIVVRSEKGFGKTSAEKLSGRNFLVTGWLSELNAIQPQIKTYVVSIAPNFYVIDITQ